MAWGRARVGGSITTNGAVNGVNGTTSNGGETAQFVNVVATGSVDLTVKVSLHLL